MDHTVIPAVGGNTRDISCYLILDVHLAVGLRVGEVEGARAHVHVSILD